MKHRFKIITLVLVSAIAGAIPIYGALRLWSWMMEQIPASSEWAGMAKIAVSLGMIVVGGGFALGWAIVFALIAGYITIEVLKIS